jgi:hypothetical protein
MLDNLSMREENPNQLSVTGPALSKINSMSSAGPSKPSSFPAPLTMQARSRRKCRWHRSFLGFDRLLSEACDERILLGSDGTAGDAHNSLLLTLCCNDSDEGWGVVDKRHRDLH